MPSEITIDLQTPPASRWRLTKVQQDQAKELLAVYKRDLGFRPETAEILIARAKDSIPPEYWFEMDALAAEIGTSIENIAVGNLYYDALKVCLANIFGCTAFAVDGQSGILHARNLDWWTENNMLSRSTTICRFKGAPAGEFLTVGWPGFTGALSGVAHKRFAITLNAVLSRDPPQLAMPVVFLIRKTLEEARSFNEALVMLSEDPIPCDCLLLLTGVKSGEMVVIERTPARHEIRHPKNGFVCVTNGYQQLDAGFGGSTSELLATWCERLNRITALLGKEHPQTASKCFDYLSDEQVRMNVTVQQMVFRAATGESWVNLPGPNKEAR